MKTSTYFSLIAEFNTAQIPLEDVCEKYFNMGHALAKRQAAKQALPVAAVKLRPGQKTKYFIMAEDLSLLIDTQKELAQKEWKSVNC